MPPVIKLLHPAAPCSGSIALHDVHCTLIFSPLEPLQFIHMKVVPRLPATINCDRCKGLQCCKANLVMRGVVWLMLAKRCRVHAMPSYIAQRQPPSCLRMLTFSLRQEAMALNKPQPPAIPIARHGKLVACETQFAMCCSAYAAGCVHLPGWFVCMAYVLATLLMAGLHLYLAIHCSCRDWLTTHAVPLPLSSLCMVCLGGLCNLQTPRPTFCHQGAFDMQSAGSSPQVLHLVVFTSGRRV